MKANCIRVTKEEVASLAKQLGISEAKAHANILLWSGDKQVDRLPTPEELKAFINKAASSSTTSEKSQSTSSGYTAEMQSIKEQAIANGTFMKAPNGNPTNLTERQWLQVRTKAFKKWFGDWEKYAKLRNATVIWGHPASGKTYLFQQGKKDIIDFDSEYKVRINKLMGLPEGADAKELRKAARKARKQEYHDLIMRLFDEAVAEAKRTGKKLLVSDMMLLREREADIDAITNMSDFKFIERNAMRGETDTANKMLWKSDINEAMRNVADKSKIIDTENFLYDDLYGTNVSKVVDENGEPKVVYHGTRSEFSVFDKEKLGEATGKGYYTDNKTGERVYIDSTYAFFFTDNIDAAYSYRNLSISERSKQILKYYKSIYHALTGSIAVNSNLTEEEILDRREFMDNVLSPSLGYDLRKALNSNSLSESEKENLAERIQDIIHKIDKVSDPRGLSNTRRTITDYKKNISTLLENRDALIEGKAVSGYDFSGYDMSFVSGYGNRNKGEVYLVISYDKENNRYKVHGIDGSDSWEFISEKNFDSIISTANRAVEQVSETLRKEESDSHFDRGYVMPVFLNIKNPLEHDYEGSAFPDKYKDTKHPTGYIAARQVRKAIADGNDGVVYRNVRDPFSMSSFGVFNSNQIKSAEGNNGEFSGESDNIYEDIGGEEGENKVLGLGKTENKPAQRKQLFFSGDANGSDKAWAQEAKVLGLNVKPYTVQDWDALSDEWKAKLDKEYQEIVQILGRNALPIDDYRGKLVRRDMMQADKADAVFAIGTIGSNGYVDGGTGYATTRGIQRGIPVYLYDRNDKRWKVWDKTKKAFVETAEPTITPNAALVGTRGDVVGKDASGRDIRDITEEEKYAIRSILEKSFPRQNGVPASSISTTGYRKGDPQKHPDTAFIFTENAEAYTFTQGLMSDAYAFPNPNNPKINVSDVNGTNQAGIRTDAQGNLTPNAFGIIVKKYQQDANGRFVAKEGQFQDTDEDFKMFKTLNEHMFNRLKQSGLKNIVFPSQIALGKSALPLRFAEWLQQELFDRFGVSSTIEGNTTPGYEGYGLKINSVVDKSSVSDKQDRPAEAMSTAAIKTRTPELAKTILSTMHTTQARVASEGGAKVQDILKAVKKGDKMSATDVLHIVANDSTSTEQEKALAVALIPLFAKAGFEVEFVDNLDKVAGRVNATGTKINFIQINLNHPKIKNHAAKTILHELTHSLTVSRIKADPKFKKVIEESIERVKEFLSDKVTDKERIYNINGREYKLPFDIYGLTNPQEFIAEAISNSDFQKLLAQVPARAISQKRESIFQKIINAICDTFDRLFNSKYNDNASVFNAIVPLIADTIVVTADKGLHSDIGLDASNWYKDRTEDEIRQAADIVEALHNAYANALIKATVAPYLNMSYEEYKKLSDEDKKKMRRQFATAAREIATAIGLEYEAEDIHSNHGGYTFENGSYTDEVSFTFHFRNADFDKVRLFSCLLGDLGYQQQETTITAVDTDDESKASGVRYTIEINDADKAAKTLDSLGIRNFTIDRVLNTITLLSYDDAEVRKIEDLLKKLKEDGNHKQTSDGHDLEQYSIQSEADGKDTRRDMYKKWLVEHKEEKGRLYSLVQEALRKHEPGKRAITVASKNGEITLTEEQQQAVGRVSDFITQQANTGTNSTGKRYITISGPAGTGKTTIIKSIIENIQKQGLYPRIAGAAVSRKAVHVLTDKLKNYGVEQESIYSLSGADPKSGKDKFAINPNKQKFTRYDLIFIDEASMVGKKVLDVIDGYLKSNPNLVIVFLGDYGQVRPIASGSAANVSVSGGISMTEGYTATVTKEAEEDSKSPVFDEKKCEVVRLTERIRQGEGSPILGYADKYYAISTGASKEPISSIKTSDRVTSVNETGGIIFNRFNPMAALRKVTEAFRRAVETEDPKIAKIISSTNEKVDYYNNLIHNSLFPGHENVFAEGELIIFNEPYSIPGSDGQDTIDNSEEGVIVSAPITRENNGIRFFEYSIKLSDGMAKNVRVLDTQDTDNKRKFDEECNRLHRIALEYDNNPDRRLRAAKWREYYNYKESFANISYGYAITVHKAQGSTYDMTFIDELAIKSDGQWGDQERAEIMYTALTRARNLAVVFSEADSGTEIPSYLALNDEIEKNKQQGTDAAPVDEQQNDEGDDTGFGNEDEGRREQNPGAQAPQTSPTAPAFISRNTAPPMVTVEKSDVAALNAAYANPNVKKFRVNEIAKRFSEKLSEKFEERIAELDNQIAAAEKEGNTTEANRLFVQRQKLTKADVLTEMGGVRNIFNDIYAQYDPESVTFESEANLYDELYERDENWTDDDFKNYIDSIVAYKKAEYQKVRDNFWALAEEATLEIKKQERIIIDISSSSVSKDSVKNDSLNEDNTSSENPTNNVQDVEEKGAEAWMNSFRSISGMSSLSVRTRAALQKLLELDKDGSVAYTDLWEERTIDPEWAHAVLLYGLADMVESSDMTRLLLELGKKYSFVRQLYKQNEDGTFSGMLVEDPQLMAAFYHDFRKDLTSYWASRGKRNFDTGEFVEDRTMALNGRENISFMLASWKHNTETGLKIGGNDSIFNENGTVNGDANRRMAGALAPLAVKFEEIGKRALSADERNAAVINALDDNNKEGWNSLIRALRSIGIDQDEEDIRWALVDSKFQEGKPIYEGVMAVITATQTVYSQIKGNPTEFLKANSKGEYPVIDILTKFRPAYTAIAEEIKYLSQGETESSFHHMDKTRYSYNTPNYLGKIMKKLQGVQGEEKFNEFIESEYGRFNWFRKSAGGQQVWLNSWLEELVKRPELRKHFKHKVVLDFNKKGFFEAGSLEYALGLLREFNAPLAAKIDGKEQELAWYYVPMLSDTDSSEFIQFTKDTQEGYQDRLIAKMRLTVYQELDRIALVKKRAEKIANKEAEPIANFDDRGKEFCFFPALNTWKDEGGNSFLSIMESYAAQIDTAEKGGNTAVKESLETERAAFIDSVLREIIENDVDETYKRYTELGVFDKTEGGAFKYLKGSKNQDLHMQNNKTFIKEVLDIARQTPDKYANFIKRAEQYLENPLSLTYSERSKLFEYASKFNTRKGEVKEQDDHREMISKYVYNSRFATSQIVQIFATDYAYYKNAVDFQKRFKEVHAPSLRLFTLAEYNGKRIGRDTERSIYLADEKIVSNTYDELKQAIDWRVKQGQLSRASGDYILAQYRKINVSDAQAYRCLSSYRAIMGMTGQWNDALENAYNKFRSGKWSIEEFTTIFQTKKPYLYTQVGIDSQVDGQQIKVGAQHKNSEFLLLAMIPSIVNGTPMQSASKLVALNEIMEEGYEEGRGIDVVNFTSAVKVGNQGVIEFTYDDRMVNIPYGGKVYANVAALRKYLDSLLTEGKITGAEHNKALEPYLLANKDADYIEQYLKEKMFVDDKDNPPVIHTFSYEDYGIQTQTPEHIIDHEQLFGTQIRRLIGADITPGTILTVGGVQMTAEQWWQTYNGLLVDNIVDSYAQVSEKFSSPEKLHALLVETIKGSDRYPKDLLNAIRLVDEIGPNGKPTGRKRFNIPLFDHATADVVESLINSVIKDTVTKQKIRGGSCIQVSSFGLSDKLSVVYEGEGKNKRVKYMECYMPAYAKDFYEGLLIPVDKEGNEITDGSQPAGYIFNPDLLDDDLRKAIGYRVPTEDKYSMAPLYIKGFLPQQNGSAIMLPAEITTLSGSDFDIDKMYIMLPEFDVIRYDKEAARRDYEQFNRKYGRTQSWIGDVFNAIMDENFDEEENESTEDSTNFSNWWKENKEKYRLARPQYRRINGSFKKSDNGISFDDGLSKKTNPTRADRERARKKRNNAIIDMMYSVLTNADTLQRFVKPGGYDEVKKQAFIERILSNVPYAELKSKLGIADGVNVSDVLNKKTVDELDHIASAFGKVLDPLSVTTQMHFHKQNSAGSKAIGIYAVNNAGQALLQHSKLSLAKSDNPSVTKIVLFGKTYTELNKVVNAAGQYITNNEAQYLAAAVDNGKDPTLEDNGQNDFTYNMSNLLIRLGVGHKEVAAIMNQPIIKEMASAVTKGAADGKSRDEIVLEVLQKYAEKAGISYTDIKVSEDIGVSLEDMYRDGCFEAEKQGAEFYKRQVMIGLWFEANSDSAQFLNNSTQNLRGDAQNAAAGPRVIDTVLRQIRIENSIKEEYGLYDSSKDYSIEEMKNHPLGFIIAFQQLGIKGTADILEEYFPHYSSDFMGALKKLIQRTKNRSISVDLAQKLFDAAVTYRLSSLPLLNSLKKGKEWVTAPKEEVVKYFYYKFPDVFKHAKETNPVVYEANGVEVHFNDIPLVQVLKTVPSGRNNPIASIVMDNAGRLTKEGKQRLTQSWESLIYSGDERAITLAINLFAYSLIRYDGKFAPSGFAHLAPVAVEEACAGYADRMEDMRKYGLNIDDDSDFRTLFLRNNTDNRTLFPKVTGKEVEALKDAISAGFISMDVASQCPSIAKVTTGEKSASVTYFNGFCIQDGKEMKYYILEPVSRKEADIVEVTPLGVKGKMVEYFIDSEFATSKSRITEDKKHAEENSEPVQSDETGFSIPTSPEDMYDIGDTTDDEGNEICK